MELKSYLSEKKRQQMINDNYSEELIWMEEGLAAYDADDMDVAWQWFAKNTLQDYNLKLMKQWFGADFIRKYGFNTINADKSYGDNWLNE